MSAPNILKKGSLGILHFIPCGSRVTCFPAPTNTDQDWIVLVSTNQWEEFEDKLLSEGWIVGGSDLSVDVNVTPAEQQFKSFTLGEDNIIVTKSPAFFYRFVAATRVAKRLNLIWKTDRIELFQAVLYGSNPTYIHEEELQDEELL